MKILSISNLDIWPAGENKGLPSIFFSQKRFAERGHDVYFLCPEYQGQSGYTDYQGIKIFRFRLPFAATFTSISSLPLDRFWPHLKSTFLSNIQFLLFQLYAFVWAIKLSLKFRPDLIYVHSLAPALVGWLVSKLLKTKLVFRVYGTRDLYWSFKLPLSRLKEFREYLVFKLKADYFIISKDGTKAKELAMSLGVREEKIINLRSGVDFKMYNPAIYTKEKICRELGISPDSKIVLSLSKLNPFYGVQRLVYCLPRLFKIDQQIVCIIARDGPQKAELEKFVYDNHIQNRVFFVGYVDRSFVTKLLNTCDVFVSLSEYSNTNNALFEAMVCGRCIVARRDETIEEMLTHKKNAILLLSGDLERLPEILAEVLSDEARRKILGEQARLRARETLRGWTVRIDQEAELLESLLKA